MSDSKKNYSIHQAGVKDKFSDISKSQVMQNSVEVSSKQQDTSQSFLNLQKDEFNTDESFSDAESNKSKKMSQFFLFHWLKVLEIEGTENYTLKQLFLLNYDLRPVEEARRTWHWYHYVFFWVSESFNVNAWEISATGAEAGLSWWVVWITVWLGYFLCACFLTAAARVGNAYHISFPVSCRSSFGIWGSLWPVINRVVMACVWFGVQSSIGGNCVELMLRSIFGNNLNEKIPDTIGGNISSFKMLSFFLFWLSQLPFIYLPPHKIRHLFTIKAIICPMAGIAFLIWALVKADGGGPVIHQKSKLEGSAFAWAFINSTMNALSNFATLIVNAPDFSRLANKPKASLWSQFIAIPIGFSITCLVGVLVTSASSVLYGVTYWNPLDVLSRFLDGYSRGDRGGVFLISFGFTIAQVGTNIAANSISAGTDMTALLPKYMNIRRGGFICAAVAYAICPWNLMSSSSMFTTYLSAYAVFLSAIAGTVFCDYYILKKGYLNIENLYIANNTSPYYYSYGINWRAYASYICGILPNIVGFVGATKTHVVPIGATYVYNFSFFTGYAASAAVLLIITLIFPIRGMPDNVGVFELKFLEEWVEVEDFEVFLDNSKHDLGIVDANSSNIDNSGHSRKSSESNFIY